MELNKEVDAIIEILKKVNIEPFVFVDEYKFGADEENEMMQKAMAAIDNSDLLIAETSEKGIGIGVEVGYAKAKGKPVMYLRNKNAEHSTTVSGISDFQVVYDDIDDIKKQLSDTLKKLLANAE